MRQRPGTAKGVMFITIEDETGFANLILWKNRIEAQRAIVIAAGALVCHGILQREGEVTHIVVERLEDAGPLLRPELEEGEIQTTPLKPRVRNFQ
ncbi:DNA polymerase III, alpha subunit [Acetobacteraceae bacterium EV16G]